MLLLNALSILLQLQVVFLEAFDSTVSVNTRQFRKPPLTKNCASLLSFAIFPVLFEPIPSTLYVLLSLVSFQLYMHSGKLRHSEDCEISDQAEKED